MEHSQKTQDDTTHHSFFERSQDEFLETTRIEMESPDSGNENIFHIVQGACNEGFSLSPYVFENVF